MKSIRVEIFQDPPRERVLVDGKERTGVTFEVAFLDAPSTSMTLHEFVTRVGKSSAAGRSEQVVDNNKDEKGEPPAESRDQGTSATPGLAPGGSGPAAESTKEGKV